jgi:hypothetical protein
MDYFPVEQLASETQYHRHSLSQCFHCHSPSLRDTAGNRRFILDHMNKHETNGTALNLVEPSVSLLLDRNGTCVEIVLERVLYVLQMCTYIKGGMLPLSSHSDMEGDVQNWGLRLAKQQTRECCVRDSVGESLCECTCSPHEARDGLRFAT